MLTEHITLGNVASLIHVDVNLYTEQQKKRIFCIFGIVYKMGFKYGSNDMQGINDAWNMCISKCITNG